MTTNLQGWRLYPLGDSKPATTIRLRSSSWIGADAKRGVGRRSAITALIVFSRLCSITFICISPLDAMVGTMLERARLDVILRRMIRRCSLGQRVLLGPRSVWYVTGFALCLLW